MNKFYTLAAATLLLATSALAQNNQKAQPQTPLTRLTGPAYVAGTHQNSDLRGSQPANDGCGSVTFDALNAGGSVTFTGDNTGATIDGDFEAGSGLETFGPCVWHGFTTTECTNITAAYCGTNPAFQNLAAFLARTCPATDADYVTYTTGNFTECGDGNATIVWENVPAGTYYFPVLLDEANSAVGPYTVNVSATSCVLPPSNDDCAGAINVPVGTFCNYSWYSSQSATESMPADSCDGFLGAPNDDIWFSFVATATDMTVGAMGAGNDQTGYDPVLEVYTGTCGSLSLYDCSDVTLSAGAESVELNGLTVGTTYYFRSFHWFAAAPGDYNVGVCVVAGAVNIGIEENNSIDWSLFPNPGTGVFTIQYTGATGLSNIEVLDVTGRVMYNTQVQLATGSTHSMDLNGLAAGNYTVRITNNGTRTEQRLLVK